METKGFMPVFLFSAVPQTTNLLSHKLLTFYLSNFLFWFFLHDLLVPVDFSNLSSLFRLCNQPIHQRDQTDTISFVFLKCIQKTFRTNYMSSCLVTSTQPKPPTYDSFLPFSFGFFLHQLLTLCSNQQLCLLTFPVSTLYKHCTWPVLLRSGPLPYIANGDTASCSCTVGLQLPLTWLRSFSESILGSSAW